MEEDSVLIVNLAIKVDAGATQDVSKSAFDHGMENIAIQVKDLYFLANAAERAEEALDAWFRFPAGGSFTLGCQDARRFAQGVQKGSSVFDPSELAEGFEIVNGVTDGRSPPFRVAGKVSFGSTSIWLAEGNGEGTCVVVGLVKISTR